MSGLTAQTRQYWLDTVLGWAEARLMPPQYEECRRALDGDAEYGLMAQLAIVNGEASEREAAAFAAGQAAGVAQAAAVCRERAEQHIAQSPFNYPKHDEARQCASAIEASSGPSAIIAQPWHLLERVHEWYWEYQGIQGTLDPLIADIDTALEKRRLAAPGAAGAGGGG